MIGHDQHRLSLLVVAGCGENSIPGALWIEGTLRWEWRWFLPMATLDVHEPGGFFFPLENKSDISLPSQGIESFPFRGDEAAILRIQREGSLDMRVEVTDRNGL